MDWEKLDKEFDLLDEYLKIYIQILPGCIQRYGKRVFKYQMPTFEYFKETYTDNRYSLVIPHYKESKTIIENHIANVHTHGLGSDNAIAYRYYNYWMGCKYYTNNNFSGNYTIDSARLNQIIKNTNT